MEYFVALKQRMCILAGQKCNRHNYCMKSVWRCPRKIPGDQTVHYNMNKYEFIWVLLHYMHTIFTLYATVAISSIHLRVFISWEVRVF